MTRRRTSQFGSTIAAGAILLAAFAAPVCADEIWVAPTYQQDIGGLGVASNTIWPVTPAGAVRFVWAVPNDLQTFQTAKVVLIPGTPGGAASVNVLVCAAQNGAPVAGTCAGPFPQAFTGVASQLAEVEIGPAIASRIGTPGSNYLAVLAYTSPTTLTDHIVGLRFAYTPKTPTFGTTVVGTSGAAFTGTNGDGSVITARRQSGDAYVTIDATTPAQSAGLVLRKNNVNRWLLFADTTPETGLNTGSDLRVDAYDDAGAAMGTSLFLERATRRVGIGTTGPTQGTLHVESTSTDVGIYGHSASLGGVGVFGMAEQVAGVAGVSVNGYGLYGHSDPGVGVHGESGSGNGVEGTSATGNAGFFDGRVRITGDLVVDGVFTNPSDISLKEQIAPLAYGVNELRRLRPVTWKWIARPQGAVQLGLIAQEVEKVLPELVQHGSDAAQPLRLNYMGLLPVAINAIQEQQAQLDKQQREIAELKRLVCVDHPDAAVCD